MLRQHPCLARPRRGGPHARLKFFARARLNRELAEIAASPEVRAILEPDGSRPLAATPAEFGARMKQDLAQWKRIAVERKIVAE
ncbi:hypothetical protein [Cupriavidus taiwanensis]|uniref:hypothetical protein n=1 Tax=Cupriavidus taiwanensis TaxID=164546 RepID=UPI000E109A26|nr:hypothetical protein [Cupriavidus taiwanensis]SPA57003.1 protein of unknown function [Cupriavidus taiwanensis]